MKLKYTLIFCLFMIFSMPKIYASDNVYINSNNVKIEKNLYLNLCDVYSNNYVEFITQETFDSIKNNDLSEIQVTEYIDQFSAITRQGSLTTDYKTLKIIKNGNLVSLILRWLILPITRSYDVFGIRFDQINLNGAVSFKQTYIENNILKLSSSAYFKSLNNGFGVSFLLPGYNTNSLESYIEFNVTGSGNIYGTYQHAQKVVSLSDSMNYTLSSSGYGAVLNFDSSVKEKYDGMGGVNISI